MKPTHWWNPKYPTMPNQLTAPHEGGGWEASYSANQLRQAKVEVLQELLRRIVKTGNHVAVEASLMADELEKQK